VVPLLVVWANLHGSAALGAGLVVLYGLRLVARPQTRVHGTLLVLGAPLALIASPYGLDLVGYYRRMLWSPQVAHVSREWRPMTVDKTTIAFFVSAFALAALWGRRRAALTGFEQALLALLFVGALAAVRNAVWFELAAAVSAPRLIDAAWPAARPSRAVQRVNVFLGIASVAAAAVLVAVQLSRAPAWLELDPPSAAASVAHAAGEHGIVLADDLHADWLLWEAPSLAGRVVYDVRFELYDAGELRRIVGLQAFSARDWRACGARARVVTFAGEAQRRLLVEAGVLQPGARPVVAGRRFGAFAQPPAPGDCTL